MIPWTFQDLWSSVLVMLCLDRGSNIKPPGLRHFAFVVLFLGCAQHAAHTSRLGLPCGALLIKTIIAIDLLVTLQT